MPQIIGDEYSGLSGGWTGGGALPPPTLPLEPNLPSGYRPPPGAGVPVNQPIYTGAGTDPYAALRAAFDPMQAARDIAWGGDPARAEATMRALGYLSPTQITAALVEKDRLMRNRGMVSGYTSNGAGGGWGSANAPLIAALTPEQIASIDPSLQQWLNPSFTQSPFSPTQPTLQMNNQDWMSIAPQYRPGIESWYRQQGFQPSGSLGQYGYNQFAPTKSVQSPFSFTQNMVNTVPDESLRAWISRLLQGKGWM